MLDKKTFKKNLLAKVIASTTLMGLAVTSIAQEAADEIVVTGLRASLKASVDQKKEASGILEVITAEDIGKFPDTNLAESLQRIPGVSINREGGEGSRVTVRGLDAQYNLVTQNGRTIAKTTGDRSFNFADIPAELVAGVAIYKTSNATVDSGGMGATIDYKSIRPLSSPGQKVVLSAKSITETSWGGGTTPEAFGLYSNTFADDTIGVALAVGYQKRDSSQARAMVDNGWRVNSASNPSADSPTGGDVNNYSKPQSVRYKFETAERERINGELVLQWAPTDAIKATLDYDTYQRTIHADKNEVSAWFTYPGAATAVWHTSQGVATPTVYAETYVPIGDTTSRPNDLSMAGGYYEHQLSGDTLGLNVAWDVSDELQLAVDVSHSTADDKPDNKLASDVNFSTAAFIRTSTSAAFNNDIFSVINGGGDAKASDMQVTGTQFSNNLNNSQVDEYKAYGKYRFNDENIIDFGIGSTEVFNRNRGVTVQQNGWGGLGTAGQMTAAFQGSEASLRSRFNGEFANWKEASALKGGATLADGTNLNTAKPMDKFFDWDLKKVLPLASSLYGKTTTADVMGDCGTAFCGSTAYDRGTDRRTTETTQFAFVQYGYTQGIFKADVGLRYEKTDVESIAANSVYSGSDWGADTEISFTGQKTAYVTKEASYSRWLPNLDLTLDVADNVKLRSSVSKSIARPSYGDIAANVGIGSNFSRTVGYASGSQGNPGLKPYESLNIDFSTEWYYGDASYVSVGAFSKKVSDFIASETVTLSGSYAPGVPQIHDPFAGVYTQQAKAAIGAGASGQQLRTWIFDHYNGQPGVTRDTSPGAATFAGHIIGQPNDPLVQFRMSQPNNAGEDRKIFGYEFAIQHMFGESGFGAQFNATSVLSDLEWDTTSTSRDQRPLLGVSDSANLVGFYEKNGWNIRVAYNWRDRYLNSYSDEGGESPVFVKPYYQIDLGVSYEITENLKLSLDGINVTDNPYIKVTRNDIQTNIYDETGARWMAGVSYSF